jgi:hypothetical protein
MQYLNPLGAEPATTAELAAYIERQFDRVLTEGEVSFPLQPEPHVAAWRHYAHEATQIGAFPALQKRLVQLQFPICAGISQCSAYRAATRRGVPTEGMFEATGLQLSNPAELQLVIHDSFAGPVPVLIAARRADFVALIQALTARNEPVPIPASMGAMMVAGFNNWDRIRQRKEQWQAEHSDDTSGDGWEQEFRENVVPDKTLYQDKFIILSDGPYSGVAADELGLSNAEWREISLTIRLEHECTHYFTRRCFGSAKNHLLDELIADYRGIVAAMGQFRADWFLRFMGLENFPAYRPGGRLENYRGEPPLSEKAFEILQELIKRAAENIEHFDREHATQLSELEQRRCVLVALCRMRLSDLASDQCSSRLTQALVGCRT